MSGTREAQEVRDAADRMYPIGHVSGYRKKATKSSYYNPDLRKMKEKRCKKEVRVKSNVMYNNLIRAYEMLGGKCARCGNRYPPCAMDFHHKDGTKTMNIGTNGKMMRWEDLAQELAHCELLCVVCHRVEHCNDEFRKSMDIYTVIDKL